MTTFKAPPTAIARKLKELRKSRNWSQAACAAKTTVSVDTIKSIESGRTQSPDSWTIARLCKAFAVEPTFLISEHSFSNYHLVRGNDQKIAQLEQRFGPSASQGLQVGEFVTTWLQYDTCDGDRYGPEFLGGTILEDALELPLPFRTLRDQLLRENTDREARGQKSFFNGPSLCLSRLAITNTAEDERSVLRLFFKRSEYANNKTAKSVNGAVLRYEALKNWRFLEQPVEFLSSGVGSALMLFTDGGKKAIFGKRSDFEEFRSKDFDVAVVEGIHPKKDVMEDGRSINLYSAAQRGFREECGVEIPQDDIRLIGFGNDLEYYQWNMLGYAVTDMTAKDVIKHWHGADDRKESEDMFAIDGDPQAVLSFCRDRAIWGSGLAAAYFSLCKLYGQSETIAVANQVFKA